MRRAPFAALALAAFALAACDEPPRESPTRGPDFALDSGDGSGPRRVDANATAIEDATEGDANDAPALVTIGGVRGLRVDGEVLYRAAADAAPVRYASTRKWVFPQRVQVTWQPVDGPAMERERWQRYGPRAWWFAPRVVEPAPLDDDGRRSLAVLDGLYRAALLWPDGFHWNGDDATGADDGSATTSRAPLDDPLAPGVELRATHSDGALAIAAHAADATGTELARLTARGRFDHPSRAFPATLEVVAGTASWTERLDGIDPRARYDDRLFLAGTGATPAPTSPILTIDRLVPRPTRRVAFEAPLADLDAAAERARAALAELDPTLAEGAAIALELDAASRSTAALLKLLPERGVPPGFEPAPRRGGRSIAVAPLARDAVVRARELLQPTGPTAPDPAWPPYLIELDGGWMLVVPNRP